MGLAIVSAVEPQWLKDLSQAGREVESRDYKDYGDNLLRNRNFSLAIAQYQKALSIQPDLTAASVNMAVAYERMGASDRAERILRQALSVKGGQKGVICFHLAAMAEKQNRTAEAVELYRQALDSDLPPQAVYGKLGNLFIREQRFSEARDAFEAALRIQEDPTSFYRDMLRASLATYAEDTTHRRNIETLLARDTREEDLAAYDLEIIRRVQAGDQDISGNYANLSTAYAGLGEIEQAIEHAQRALQIWPGNTSARRNLDLLHQMRAQAGDSVKTGS